METKGKESTAASTTPTPPKIAIIGAGIMGASTAYYLSKKNLQATVYEASTIGSGASGKSAGFLAQDWNDHPVSTLATHSFNLHAQLAKELPDDIEYRSMSAYSLPLSTHAEGRAANNKGMPDDLQWLDNRARATTRALTIGTHTTCAQVTPLKLTRALLAAAGRNAGTSVTYARVTDVRRTDSVIGSEGDEDVTNKPRWRIGLERRSGEEGSGRSDEVAYADIVVLCMGPWTIHAQKWFPRLPATLAQKAASLVAHDVRLPAAALFTQMPDAAGQRREPEIYPRRNEVYMCQTAVPADLPECASDVVVDGGDAADLAHYARTLNKELALAVTEGRFITQACFLPLSVDGVPMIGAVGDAEGCYVAAGHSCWGILNAPGTGSALADVIGEGVCNSVHLPDFSPQRFE